MPVRALTALALATLVVATNFATSGHFATEQYFATQNNSLFATITDTINLHEVDLNNSVGRVFGAFVNASDGFGLDGEDSAFAAVPDVSGEVENKTDADGIIYELTDEEYYKMPKLFDLDEYPGCLATRGIYCLGSFELQARTHNPLFTTMKRYSANYVHNFNHTRLHRGVCVTRRCGAPPPEAARDHPPGIHAWFASCVNESMMSTYNLSARLYQLDYCVRGPDDQAAPLNTNERAFAALVAVLLALTAISTTLDLTLSDHAKKGARWALSWSLRQSWRALVAPPATSTTADLTIFDGLRVFCMMCVIIEHVCWLGTLSYIADTRSYEQTRLAGDAILMTNSTLVVQIFFLMASFLLANKLLLDKQHLPPVQTFFKTMLNRVIRISPSYYFVVWFAGTWWERLGAGPQWVPLVRAEAAVCRRKWWTQLLYLNNLVQADEKCLIQTWYLAADMQLYALALVLTLALRGRRCAIPLLGVLFVGVTVFTLGLAYAWELVPTLVVHRPESVRVKYSGERSFNALYQSPLGNAAGALAGLLLAHAHHALRGSRVITRCQVFRWVSVLGAPAALWWAALSPLALGAGPPPRGVAAALAALERPVFIACVAVALLGAINGIRSPWRSWFAAGGTVLARLSFGALLLHIPLHAALLAQRLAPAQLDRPNAILEWFGVACLSYAAAVPLALFVEIPAMRLHRELTASPLRPRTLDPPADKPSDKTDT
ncbi:O-acyltransferase like protein-like [Epargyreus clarus]|uniref:O-acyltransferase like protein-like n=1 Tax=Epargyreus clarus TaxID=520877 RepID=UPI003C2D195E